MNAHAADQPPEKAPPGPPDSPCAPGESGRYRDLFDHLPIGLYQSLPDGRIVDANPALVQMLGYPDREALLQVQAQNLYSDLESRARWQSEMSRHGLIRNFEVQLRRFDGSNIWVRESTRAITEGQGAVQCYEGAMEDITEQRESAAALSRSEALLRATVDRAPIVLWAIDRDGRITISAGQALEPAGLKHGELVGKSIFEADVFQSEFQENLQRTFQGQPTTLESETFGRSWETHLTPMFDQDKSVIGAIGVSIDNTERKQSAEALHQTQQQFLLAQKMEAIGRLAGGIAHDFNNLLMVVTGYSDLLMERLSNNPAARKDVDEIVRATERASALTHQLLAFSRRQVLQPRVLDLNFVVSDMDKMLRRVIGEDIELVTLTTPELGRILADRGQIEQIILNLALNARDAMPNGGRLSLETADVTIQDNPSRRMVELVPGAYVRLSVTDTGFGMDQDLLSRIFEPFFTTKPQGKGTGLGLSTVYGIVQQSGGSLTVESQPGRGTRFKIYLPRINDASDETQQQSTIPTSIHGTETILLVEDEEKVRGLVREILERFGYNIIEATSGQDAIELCRMVQAPIHLMLTDVVMPGIGGRELAAQVAQLRPEMKVLFMSGYAERSANELPFLESGVAFLEKPFTFSTLSHKLREVLGS